MKIVTSSKHCCEDKIRVENCLELILKESKNCLLVLLRWPTISVCLRLRGFPGCRIFMLEPEQSQRHQLTFFYIDASLCLFLFILSCCTDFWKVSYAVYETKYSMNKSYMHSHIMLCTLYAHNEY